MRADTISPSRIDMYLSCPQKYEYYTNGTTPRPSYGANVGSCFHEAMEVYVDSLFSMSWEEAMNWSITYVQSFRPAVVKEALKIGREWLSHNPLPSKEQIFSTEVSFGPPGYLLRGKPVKSEVTFDTGLSVVGIIDLVWIDGDTIVVGDYKTQRSWITPDELANKIQAMVYALAVHQFAPDRPIRVEFYMIRYPENGPVIWSPDPDSFGEMERLLYAYQKRVREDTTHVAMPGSACKFCNYNYTCENFRVWAQKQPPNQQLWDTMDLEDLIHELDFWHSRFQATKNASEHLKGLVQDQMEAEHLDKIGNWKITRKAWSEFDGEVEPLVKEYGGRKNLPVDLAAELEPFRHTVYGKPHLRQVKW